MRSARVYPKWSEVHVPLAATSATDPGKFAFEEHDENYGLFRIDVVNLHLCSLFINSFSGGRGVR